MDDIQNNFYSPSQVSNYISQLFSGDVFLNNVSIVGEVSGFKPSPAGHVYFDLKDRGATIRITVWKSIVFQNPEFRQIKNGQVIRLIGKIQNYEQGGSYSLVPTRLFLTDDEGSIDAKIKA
ncbi:MAG: exodeoxyribonuclease VII large subunit, partial [Lactobacillaceae bacterium]|nr:exodeoxyribonuclease VII large subunit [Lactobacillaceae bacterium]